MIVVAIVYRIVIKSKSRCVKDEVEKTSKIKRVKSKTKGHV